MIMCYLLPHISVEYDTISSCSFSPWQIKVSFMWQFRMTLLVLVIDVFELSLRKLSFIADCAVDSFWKL